MKKERLTIGGMNCPHCAMAVERELKQIENLEVLDVSIGSADIRYDENAIDFNLIEAAVKEAGYEIKERSAV